LQPAERSIPKPAENEVLIKIKAAGINRPDIAQRQGRYPAPPGAPADVPLESEGVDVILDMVGGDYVPKNIRLLRPAGRMVFINAMKGGEMNLNIRDIIKKRLTIKVVHFVIERSLLNLP
jgi:NADPH:quinone reductase-like Zn-dependent oxidoreductase